MGRIYTALLRRLRHLILPKQIFPNLAWGWGVVTTQMGRVWPNTSYVGVASQQKGIYGSFEHVFLRSVKSPEAFWGREPIVAVGTRSKTPNIADGCSGHPVRLLARNVKTWNVNSDPHMMDEALKMQQWLNFSSKNGVLLMNRGVAWSER